MKFLLSLSMVLLSFNISGIPQVASPSASSDQSQIARAWVEHAIAAAAPAPEAAGDRNFALSGNMQIQGANGPHTVKVVGRGLHDFHLEITLPDGGTHSVIQRTGTGGMLRRSDGSTTRINNNILAGTEVPFLPLPGLLRDLLSTAAVVTDLGEDVVGNRGVRHVALSRQFSPNADHGGVLTKHSRIDLFIDSQDFEILKMQHTAPDATGRWSTERSVTFGDYRNVNGIIAPFVLSEALDGQPTWVISISSLDLSPKIQDSDFQF